MYLLIRTPVHQQEEYIGRKGLACDVQQQPNRTLARCRRVRLDYIIPLMSRGQIAHASRTISALPVATEGAGSVELFDTFCTVPVIASSAPIRRAKHVSQPPSPTG